MPTPARSYRLKDVSPAELLVAVRKAVRGKTIIHPRVAAKMMQALHGAAEKAESPSTDLSKPEKGIRSRRRC